MPYEKCIICNKRILRLEKQPPVLTEVGKIHFECYVPYLQHKIQIEEAHATNQ